MGRRRQARELALKIVFQVDLGGAGVGEACDYFLADAKAGPETLDYARLLATGVCREWKRLDALIAAQSHHWKLDRISAVDRNILRVGAFELLHCPEVPPDVAINEAIEIAKKFSTSESGKFVNGILDKLQPGTKGGAPAAPQPPGKARKNRIDKA